MTQVTDGNRFSGTGEADLLIATANDVCGEWLGAVLGVDNLIVHDTSPIGTGQMSLNYRIRYTVNGEPGSVVIKLASENADSRNAGLSLGVYEREIGFYRNLGATIESGIPRNHLSIFDPATGCFTLVLQDVAPAEQGDQIRGCTVAQAELALTQLAQLQAPLIERRDRAVDGWLEDRPARSTELMELLFPTFMERLGDRFSADELALFERFISESPAWFENRNGPFGLVHGDFRPDNILFDTDRCFIVDWQTVAWAPAMHDLSYFLGGALEPEDRREHEERLVRHYHHTLLDHGCEVVDWDTCWHDYRRQSFSGLQMGLIAVPMVEKTPRGDDMFVAMMRRAAHHVQDLGAFELLGA